MTSALNMPAIIRSGALSVRRHPILMAPTVVSIALSFVASSFTIKSQEDIRGIFLQMVLAIILNVYAHGVTVAMAWEIHQRGATSLKTATLVAGQAFSRLLPLSLLIGLSFSIGFSMFMLPGLAAALFFMYTMSALAVGNLSAYDAIAEGARVMRENFRTSLSLLGTLALTSIVIGLMSLSLMVVPVIGLLANVIISSGFTAAVSVILLQTYLAFTSEQDKETEEDTPSPPPPTDQG